MVNMRFASVTPIKAPIEVVWSVMTDHVRYSRWGAAKSVTFDREGTPAPNGLGAIRCFHAGPIKMREEVTLWEPPHRMCYRLNSRHFTKEYASEMRLRDDAGLTVLEWSSSFVPRLPGTRGIVLRMFTKAVERFAAGIRSESEAKVTDSDAKVAE